MAPRMEFFKGAQNFTMGNVEFNTVQGDYHDYSVRNVRNTFGNRNRYYTNNSNSFNDYSNNYAGDYHAPSTHYHGAVNNVGRVENASFGDNYGTINQETATQGGGNPPRPAGQAGPGFNQGPPPGPRPGPLPNDRDFTASSTAVPQHQGFQQERGPPSPEQPYPIHRPQSGPPMPEGNQARQQQQRPPPPAFPPSGPQGYPQHPAQNPSFRPSTAPFPPPQQQQQPPPPPQQQQRQGSEQWPGQYAYKAGMQHLRETSPASWDMNSPGSSDTSDEDGSETEEDMVKKRMQRQNQKTKRMEDPNRTDYAGMTAGGSGAAISVGGGSVSATAAGGARMSLNFGPMQGVAPIPPQSAVFNQVPQRAPSPAAPLSSGRIPQPEFPPSARRDPSPQPQRNPSPRPEPAMSAPQQQPQRAPSPAVAPVAADDLLAVPPRGGPMSNLALHLAASGSPTGRRSMENSEEDEDGSSIHESPSSSPQDKKKKKKRGIHFNLFHKKK